MRGSRGSRRREGQVWEWQGWGKEENRGSMEKNKSREEDEKYDRDFYLKLNY